MILSQNPPPVYLRHDQFAITKPVTGQNPNCAAGATHPLDRIVPEAVDVRLPQQLFAMPKWIPPSFMNAKLRIGTTEPRLARLP